MKAKTTVDCCFITNMLKNCKVTSFYSNRSVSIIPTRGCPQGVVLSPLFWFLDNDDLLQSLHQRGFNGLGYAIDLVIMSRVKFETTIWKRTYGQALNLIKEFLKSDTHFNINPYKTSLTLFTKWEKSNNSTLILRDKFLNQLKN